jgi:hypothetical protein
MKTLRNQLEYVFCLPEVGDPIKTEARRIVEEETNLLVRLTQLKQRAATLETDCLKLWKASEVRRAKHDSKTDEFRPMIRWTTLF